jgi:hypothetical protein
LALAGYIGQPAGAIPPVKEIPESVVMIKINKYPSTTHIEGSRHQLGDSKDDRKIALLIGKDLTIEEKIDGANAGMRFDHSGELHLQSRGHFLTGGPRERHFSLFKTWANVHSARIWESIGDRFTIYGEWVFAKHTVYYDHLPAYFLEFDVLDNSDGRFLSTDARRELLFGLPIVPVPVIHRGPIKTVEALKKLVKPSLYRTTAWRNALAMATRMSGSRADMVEAQTDFSDLAEGLYIKSENARDVEDRLKFVRGDFLQTIQSSDSHWHDRPIIQNGLAPNVDLFAEATGIPGAYDDQTI